ncbi:hypothetical protein ES332_A12G186100v1, partial [Gossypium tomentosum]
LEINKGNNNDGIGVSTAICRTIKVQSGIPPPILPIRFSSCTFGSEPTSPFYCVLMLVGNGGISLKEQHAQFGSFNRQWRKSRPSTTSISIYQIVLNFLLFLSVN